MPHAKQGLRLDLRTLILLLSTLTALVMLLTSYFASYRVQRQLLIDHSLESNRVYAAKLASITETFISSAMQQLAFSAQDRVRQMDDTAVLDAETERLQRQSSAFNSVFVVDAQGVMRAISPAPLRKVVGKKLDSPGAIEALREQRPLVSMPYVSAANNLVVVLSQPIHDAQGKYLGYVGGTLYLREHNVLNSLLGKHFYQDGSYLYVVDRNRRLLYHPDPQRVGTVVGDNRLLDDLAHRAQGTERLYNSLGVEMLAGFATVPSTGWGVIAQQPLARTVEPSQGLILNVVTLSAPLALLGGLALWWLALTITRPLWQLAAGARALDHASTPERIRAVRAWYFEAAELKRALLFGLNLLQERIGRLHRDVQTDPLTGLGNRRGLDLTLSLLQAEGQAFCAIVLDVDHFKRINDNHGHDVGDQVLRALAELMRSCCREGDMLCRTGGEEFLMLLPGASLDRASSVAERLRRVVEDAAIDPVGAVTISLGVARWAGNDEDPLLTLSKADRALYVAKQGGRNRISIAPA
ncbi:sensor domain-containing diguanylate cyclase [Pseudomonas sp. NPDC089554]|uniref:sensor domain-containing diguanylate cyclase n=1 Tax=Pseudomonas sp. NPDC089554 TaxID=3390653 RepID=UPI003D06FA8F